MINTTKECESRFLQLRFHPRNEHVWTN
ncbi:hypothetical protein Atc_1938 [Acidithiobacillus caldus SM-1]|uniref:Uncharacterized protein n=1 Tax=Acidithiobacillus caldus (strain SM-1) TaxID=990288 RepID=F9ZQ19_ACICS|nr:hypothetical protein Atc_1938 [Acidithiobacillus caldus SM-1]